MYLSIMREYHWPPSVLEGLFFDEEDYFGLYTIIKDIDEMYQKAKEKAKKKLKDVE